MAVVQYTFTHKQYTEQHNNLGDCGPCPILGRFTLAFALQLRKKHGKPQSYHIISYINHIISYIISYHIISYHIQIPLTLERNLIEGCLHHVQKTSVQSNLVLYTQIEISYFMFQVSHFAIIRRSGDFLAIR